MDNKISARAGFPPDSNYTWDRDVQCTLVGGGVTEWKGSSDWMRYKTEYNQRGQDPNIERQNVFYFWHPWSTDYWGKTPAPWLKDFVNFKEASCSEGSGGNKSEWFSADSESVSVIFRARYEAIPKAVNITASGSGAVECSNREVGYGQESTTVTMTPEPGWHVARYHIDYGGGYYQEYEATGISLKETEVKSTVVTLYMRAGDANISGTVKFEKNISFMSTWVSTRSGCGVGTVDPRMSSQQFTVGDTYSCTATPGVGCKFYRWVRETYSKYTSERTYDTVYTHVITGVIGDVGINAVAEFEYKDIKVNVKAEHGLAMGSGVYHVGDKVGIDVIANAGWRFVRWSNGSTDKATTITVPDGGNITLTATLEKIETSKSSVRSLVSCFVAFIMTIIGFADVPSGFVELSTKTTNDYLFVKPQCQNNIKGYGMGGSDERQREPTVKSSLLRSEDMSFFANAMAERMVAIGTEYETVTNGYYNNSWGLRDSYAIVPGDPMKCYPSYSRDIQNVLLTKKTEIVGGNSYFIPKGTQMNESRSEEIIEYGEGETPKIGGYDICLTNLLKICGIYDSLPEENTWSTNTELRNGSIPSIGQITNCYNNIRLCGDVCVLTSGGGLIVTNYSSYGTSASDIRLYYKGVRENAILSELPMAQEIPTRYKTTTDTSLSYGIQIKASSTKVKAYDTEQTYVSTRNYYAIQGFPSEQGVLIDGTAPSVGPMIFNAPNTNTISSIDVYVVDTFGVRFTDYEEGEYHKNETRNFVYIQKSKVSKEDVETMMNWEKGGGRGYRVLIPTLRATNRGAELVYNQYYKNKFAKGNYDPLGEPTSSTRQRTKLLNFISHESTSPYPYCVFVVHRDYTAHEVGY